MSWESIQAMLYSMVIGSGQALQIFALTAVLAVPLGFLVALGRSSQHSAISGPIRIYQLIARGTPLMLQLMFFLYGPTYIMRIFSIKIVPQRFLACIFAFVINYAAYFGEIFRAGIDSIPKGQYEAGKVLGYNKTQTFLHIVLPQVVKRIIPPTGSEFMVLIKDTALAQIIAQPQLFDVATKSASKNASVIPYLAAGAFYLIMNAVIEYAFKRVENKLNYYH